MPEKSQNIQNDFLDALEILHIRKITVTAWMFLKNPKLVVDSIAEGKNDYVKPIKFLLAIGTPVIIILSFFNPDVGKWEMSNLFHNALTNRDPWVREVDLMMAKALQAVINKLTGEWTPLIYLILMPGLALLTKWFYKAQRRPFYYYFSIVYYVGGVLALFDLTSSLIIPLAFKYNLAIENMVMAIQFLIMVYFYSRIFPGGLKEKVKAFSTVLAGTVLYALSSFLALAVITYSKSDSFNLKDGFVHNYIPPYGMGEYGNYLNAKSDSLIKMYGLATHRGFVVELITPKSPADDVGLREGDVITRIKNTPIINERDYRIAMDSLKTGDTVIVLVNRLGAETAFHIPVLRRDSIVKKPKVLMGIRREFSSNSVNINGFRSGSKITLIAPGSPAEKAGLKVNDLITRIDDDTLKSANWDWRAFIRIVQKHPGDTTRVSVIRDNNSMEVLVIMEAANKVH